MIVRLRSVIRSWRWGSRLPRRPSSTSKKRTCRLQSSAESGYAANPRGWNACKYTLQSQPARLSPAARPLLSLTVDGNLITRSLAGLRSVPAGTIEMIRETRGDHEYTLSNRLKACGKHGARPLLAAPEGNRCASSQTLALIPDSSLSCSRKPLPLLLLLCTGSACI